MQDNGCNLQQWNLCDQDHTRFIPIHKFSKDDLPKDMEGKGDVFRIIILYAYLTVRIHIETKSPKRPKRKKSKVYEEEVVSSSGSGYVFSICSGYNELSKMRCQCKTCRGLPENQASTIWWLITLYTANHVVFDDFEAQQARCLLNFDDESQVPKQDDYIDGYKMDHADKKDDRSRFVCATCNSGLVERLKSNLKEIETLCKKIPKQYRKGKSKGKPCFIVSHPHRRAKHITIGQVLCKKGGKYKYDTATCPGSSGAAVYIVGKKFEYFNYVHCQGDHDSGKNVGTSSCGYKGKIVSLKTLIYFKKVVYDYVNNYIYKLKKAYLTTKNFG